jgi:hypothetical protein
MSAERSENVCDHYVRKCCLVVSANGANVEKTQWIKVEYLHFWNTIRYLSKDQVSSMGISSKMIIF